MARKMQAGGRDEGSVTSHAFADKTDRFFKDALLRQYGFKIYARPKEGPAIWIKEGVTYSQRAALKTLPKDAVRNSGYLEDVYYDKVLGD